jgi:hypothetical protein
VWITQREAATVLAGIGLGRAQARHLLTSGLAGPVSRISGAMLYDAEQVRGLAAREFVDDEVLTRVCPRGLYIARLARGTTGDATHSWEARARSLASQPPMTPMTRALIGARITAGGSMPWVVTISGLVAFGAEATSLRRDGSGRSVFALDPPGPWFGALDGRWLPTGRGRPWVIREAVRGGARALQE